MSMMTIATVITILAQCANGDRTCYVRDNSSWGQIDIYVVACEFDRTTSGVKNHGKILKSYEDEYLKLEVIECHDAWI